MVQKCDAVICYCNNGYFSAKAGKKENKVVISYIGGDPYELLICRNNISGKILAPIARYMWKTRVRNSDYVHYCHEFFFDKYPTSGKRLACSGVNIVSDESVLQRRIKKIDDSTNGDKFVLGLIGYTKNKIKGIDRAIKAISELGQNYYLEVVGRGEIEEQIQLAEQLHCSDRIKFKGILRAKDILTWLDSVDIYVQPSRAEGLPRATIEAMSRGCPVVCSNAGALSQIINNRFVFTQDSSDKLSKLISDISNSETMRIEAIANFNKAKEFEKSERERKYNEFYTEIVDEIKKRKLTNNLPN